MPETTPKQRPGISKITISGFKSLYDETSVEIRPLTVLAGANSSGKSSIMLPLLLMKQTLEAQYDPGTFLLDGPNVRFTSTEQFLIKKPRNSFQNFVVQIEVENNEIIEFTFSRDSSKKSIEISSQTSRKNNDVAKLKRNLKPEQIKDQLYKEHRDLVTFLELSGQHPELSIKQMRFFLVIFILQGFEIRPNLLNDTLQKMIHIPGIRLQPERNYKRTAINNNFFVGTFDNYVGSV